jgi:hypothetical protein
MPQTFKCTWFFDGVQANPGATSPSYVGWTETWYTTTSGTIEQVLAQMRSVTNQSYAGLRAPFLAGNYDIRWCRASVVTNPRFSKTCGFQAAVQGQTGRIVIPDTVVGPAAQVNCCIMVDFYVPPQNILTDKAHHRRFLIRGLPVGLINQNIINEASPFYNNVIAFCNYLGQSRAPNLGVQAGGTWQMRIQDPATNYVAITTPGVVPTLVNPQQIQLTAALGALAMNQKVTIRKVTYPSFANRVWTVLQAAAGPPYLLGTFRRQLSGAWSNDGQAYVPTWLYVAPTQYVIVGLRDRHTGRPFNLTRGRRRVR